MSNDNTITEKLPYRRGIERAAAPATPGKTPDGVPVVFQSHRVTRDRQTKKLVSSLVKPFKLKDGSVLAVGSVKQAEDGKGWLAVWTCPMKGEMVAAFLARTQHQTAEDVALA